MGEPPFPVADAFSVFGVDGGIVQKGESYVSKLTTEQKMELMRQTSEIVKSASMSPKLGWNLEAIVELTENVYKKMVELLESESNSNSDQK